MLIAAWLWYGRRARRSDRVCELLQKDPTAVNIIVIMAILMAITEVSNIGNHTTSRYIVAIMVIDQHVGPCEKQQ